MGTLGALSVDMTQANSTLPDDSQHDGQSVRFLYNKSLNESGTNIQLVGYRYSTSGYFNFADTTYSRMNGYNIETQDGVIQVKPKFTDYYNLAYNKRGKLQLTVTQQLGRTSTLYLSGSHQTYWGTSNVDEQFQAGLNTAFEDINWTLSYSLTKNAWQKGRDQMFIQLVGYRYSTSGYFNFADTTYSRMNGYNIETQDGVIQVKPKFTDYYNLAYNKRGKLQLTVTQQLGRTSTLYLSGSHQTYWGTSNVDEQFQAGLNTAFEDINWTLSYSLTKNAWQKGRDQMLALNVNIPFSHWLRSDSKSQWRHASASYSMSHDLNGRMTNLAGVYGTLLEDNNLSYSVQTGYAGGGDGNSGSTGYATLNYRGGYGNANIGYSHSDDIKQLYYGVSGGVLAHANGVTLGQPLNDTVVLVKAPGAKDAKVENQTGVRTDWRGYAVLPYATEYRENRVALDTNTLADNVDLDNAVANVVPTRGAIVRAEFKARVGIKLLMTLTHNNKPLPFGAMVTSESSQSSGIVADNGQVYLSGMPLAGKVQVKWGEEENAHCVANYQLPPESQQQLLTQLSAECR